jgi:hypothetical protein
MKKMEIMNISITNWQLIKIVKIWKMDFKRSGAGEGKEKEREEQ